VDADKLLHELSELEAAVGRLAIDHARRVVSEVAYRSASSQLEVEVDALRAQLAVAEAAAEAPAAAELEAAAASLSQLWHKLEPTERRAALATLVCEVRVRRAERYREPVRDRVEVVWR
jgi:hypothetical protein